MSSLYSQGIISEAIAAEDVFCSQFRVEAGTPKSLLEVIDWGLQYIERVRKANYEEITQFV